MLQIKKVIGEDSVQRLPDVIDTPIFDKYQKNEFKSTQAAKTAKMLYLVYMALSKRENYYQDNTPTAFGNPEYNYLCGVFVGLCQAYSLTEYREDDKIIIKKSDDFPLMVVDKIERTNYYHACVRDNAYTRRQLGI